MVKENNSDKFLQSGEFTVLSLFDGMSCGQIALNRIGLKPKQYFASEIDKYAIQVTQSNFPNTIQLGDITKVFAKDLPKIDLLIGGSPCQGFSFAGKQLAFDDPRSKLFFEFVRLKNECNPTYFMLENVKMKHEFEIIISKYLGVAPIEINSALVSAQNRVRLYWTNIANEPYGLFGDMQCTIPQPKDKGILLRDILETDVPDKYYLSEKALKFVLDETRIKKKYTQNGSEADKSLPHLAKNKTNWCGDFIFHNTMPRSSKTGKGGTGLLSRKDGKTYCLDTGQTNAIEILDKSVIQLSENKESGGKQPYQQNRVYDTNGVSPALMGQMSCGSHAILDKSPCLHCFEHGTNGQFNKQLAKEGIIRRLTPTECERLQTVDDNYTNFVSDSQRYRMLGNGWTVDVIAYIFGFLRCK